MANIIGQTILNQYRVDEFIASGGMGAVYKVWDLKRNVPLAMKVLHADFADDPTSFKYFQREARALRKLRHPNVVPFYGLEQSEQGVFILEHYIDGPSLRDVLKTQPKGMPVPEALTYIHALCAALGYAHASGVVHCDIKPGNVMVDSDRRIYLADFGIARHAESTSTTIAGAGTPGYMAPEQIRSDSVTPAADIYSLGVLFFELLTGQRPFRGDEQTLVGATSSERVRYAHLNLAPPDPRSLNPNIPPALAEIVLKCLEKEPGERYASTGDLLNALALLGVVPATRVQISVSPPVAGKPNQPRPAQKPVQPQKNTPPILWIGGIAVSGFIIIVVLGLMVFSIVKQPTPTNTSGDQLIFPSAPQATEALPVIINQPSESAPIEPPMEIPSETPIPPAVPTEIPSPTPAPALSNYDLAFVSDRDGNLRPFVFNTNNPTDYKSFDNPPGYEKTIWPTFCGGKLAVEASGANVTQWVYLYDESGQPYPWNHPKSASLLGMPRCSPNGQYLAYTAKAGDYADIYIAEVNSGEILHKPDSHSYGKLAVYTSWLGDSSTFIFEMVTQPNETFLSVSGFPSAPTSPRQISLGSNGVLARFSPDGSQVAFSCNDGQLCVSNLNNGSVKSIYQTTWNDQVTPEWIIKVSPVWSADGQWIYFASVEGGDWDILRIRPDGNGLQNLTESWTSNEITPATR